VRLALLVFLAVVVPAAAFWAGTGMPPPGRAASDFLGQVKSLKGRSAPASRDADRGEAPEPEEAPKPAPEPPPPPPLPEAPDPREEAEALYLAGRFVEAAAAYGPLDAQREAEARFAAALERAFPERLPDLPYYAKVETAAGITYDGFGEEKQGSLVLSRPAGATLSLPLSSIRLRVPGTREEFLRGARREAADAVDAPDADEKRLFFLVQQSFTIGDRVGAAPLVRRALEVDAKSAFLLSAFQARIADRTLREEVFRAYTACQRVVEPAPEPAVVRAPGKIGGGSAAAAKSRKPIVKDAKAQELMGRARPLREKGDEIYMRVAMNALLDKSAPGDVAEVDEALRLFHDADRLYEQVVGIEPDNAAVAAIARVVSRRVAQLEMLRTQLTAGVR